MKNYDQTVAFHMRKAVRNDLLELFSESEASSPTSRTQNDSICSELSVSSPREENVCQVQFKHGFCHYTLPMQFLEVVSIGEFVIVQSFMEKSQVDLGVVTRIYNPDQYRALKFVEGPFKDEEENKVGIILRVASLLERSVLPIKYQREKPLLTACQGFVRHFFIPMTVYGLEFQFDGNVLFVYYVSEYRVDFRPLIKFLIRNYCNGIRIQMKKTNLCREFQPLRFATEGLMSGKYCMTGTAKVGGSDAYNT